MNKSGSKGASIGGVKRSHVLNLERMLARGGPGVPGARRRKDKENGGDTGNNKDSKPSPGQAKEEKDGQSMQHLVLSRPQPTKRKKKKKNRTVSKGFRAPKTGSQPRKRAAPETRTVVAAPTPQPTPDTKPKMETTESADAAATRVTHVPTGKTDAQSTKTVEQKAVLPPKNNPGSTRQRKGKPHYSAMTWNPKRARKGRKPVATPPLRPNRAAMLAAFQLPSASARRLHGRPMAVPSDAPSLPRRPRCSSVVESATMRSAAAPTTPQPKKAPQRPRRNSECSQSPQLERKEPVPSSASAPLLSSPSSPTSSDVVATLCRLSATFQKDKVEFECLLQVLHRQVELAQRDYTAREAYSDAYESEDCEDEQSRRTGAGGWSGTVKAFCKAARQEKVAALQRLRTLQSECYVPFLMAHQWASEEIKLALQLARQADAEEQEQIVAESAAQKAAEEAARKADDLNNLTAPAAHPMVSPKMTKRVRKQLQAAQLDSARATLGLVNATARKSASGKSKDIIHTRVVARVRHALEHWHTVAATAVKLMSGAERRWQQSMSEQWDMAEDAALAAADLPNVTTPAIPVPPPSTDTSVDDVSSRELQKLDVDLDTAMRRSNRGVEGIDTLLATLDGLRDLFASRQKALSKALQGLPPTLDCGASEKSSWEALLLSHHAESNMMSANERMFQDEREALQLLRDTQREEAMMYARQYEVSKTAIQRAEQSHDDARQAEEVAKKAYKTAKLSLQQCTISALSELRPMIAAVHKAHTHYLQCQQILKKNEALLAEAVHSHYESCQHALRALRQHERTRVDTVQERLESVEEQMKKHWTAVQNATDKSLMAGQSLDIAADLRAFIQSSSHNDDDVKEQGLEDLLVEFLKQDGKTTEPLSDRSLKSLKAMIALCECKASVDTAFAKELRKLATSLADNDTLAGAMKMIAEGFGDAAFGIQKVVLGQLRERKRGFKKALRNLDKECVAACKDFAKTQQQHRALIEDRDSAASHVVEVSASADRTQQKVDNGKSNRKKLAKRKQLVVSSKEKLSLLEKQVEANAAKLENKRVEHKQRLTEIAVQFAAQESDRAEVMRWISQSLLGHNRSARAVCSTQLSTALSTLPGLIPTLSKAAREEQHRANRPASAGLARDTGKASCVVNECIAYLKAHGMQQEGLFRLAGSSVHVEDLYSALQQGTPLSGHSSPVHSPHVVADVLKRYLRDATDGARVELKVPLDLQDDKNAVDTECEHLLACLPDDLRADWVATLQFLQELAKHEDVNKMSASNLAVCVSPNLFRDGQDTNNMTLTAKLMKTMRVQASLTTALIEHAHRWQ